MIVFGNYTYKNTFLHHLDPRSKLLFLLIFSLSIFFSNNNNILMLYIFITLILIKISKFSYMETFKSIIPISPFLLFSFFLQVFFYGDGEILYSNSFLTIYNEGLVLGINYIIKIVTVLLLATLITNCTKPLDLTEAIKYLLFPLKYIGVPVRDIAMSISIAITFIPFIFNEAIKIRNAQLIRGGNISLFKLHLLLYSMVLPIIINTLDRSDKLALSMELRGYKLNPHKIVFKNLRWTINDTLFSFSALLIFSANWIS